MTKAATGCNECIVHILAQKQHLANYTLGDGPHQKCRAIRQTSQVHTLDRTGRSGTEQISCAVKQNGTQGVMATKSSVATDRSKSAVQNQPISTGQCMTLQSKTGRRQTTRETGKCREFSQRMTCVRQKQGLNPVLNGQCNICYHSFYKKVPKQRKRTMKEGRDA